MPRASPCPLPEQCPSLWSRFKCLFLGAGVSPELGVDIYIKMEERDDFPEGLVIKTEPAAGETINSGDVVTIYVAMEEVQRTRIVPNVVGTDVAEARRLISNAGLRVKVVETANEQPMGTVIWQNHGGGVELPTGSLIEIHVSVGP